MIVNGKHAAPTALPSEKERPVWAPDPIERFRHKKHPSLAGNRTPDPSARSLVINPATTLSHWCCQCVSNSCKQQEQIYQFYSFGLYAFRNGHVMKDTLLTFTTGRPSHYRHGPLHPRQPRIVLHVDPVCSFAVQCPHTNTVITLHCAGNRQHADEGNLQHLL